MLDIWRKAYNHTIYVFLMMDDTRNSILSRHGELLIEATKSSHKEEQYPNYTETKLHEISGVSSHILITQAMCMT